jgi:hypothetical protein
MGYMRGSGQLSLYVAMGEKIDESGKIPCMIKMLFFPIESRRFLMPMQRPVQLVPV